VSAGRHILRRRARVRAIGHAFRADARRRPQAKVIATVVGLLAMALLVSGLVAGAGGIWATARYQTFAESVVPPEQLIASLPRGGARVYDRHGELLYEFVDELSGLRRPVPLAEISPWMVKATISTEDQSFYTNNGLNTRGLMRAAVENFTPFRSSFLEGSGGSSITQQLAKNVYIPREERAQRSVDRKFKETVIALELTKRYSKDQILEWYLNSISYGGIYTGVQAAAEGYFGKDAKDLTLPEAALLAGIPQSPAGYAPLQGQLTTRDEHTLTPGSPTKARQLEVLRLMVEHGAITQQQADEAARTAIEFRPNRFEIQAAHFVLGRVASEITRRFGQNALFHDGLEVTTTIDLRLQRRGEKILEQYIKEFGEEAKLFNGALVALNPKTGEILAYIGSRDYFRDDIQGRNDNVVAQNSPGSTLKPFTYMTAFTEGWGTGTAILDTPTQLIDFATGQPYVPRNPIDAELGPITVAEALGNSLNVSAVKTIQFAGVQRTVQMLKQVGYTTLHNPRGYGPSLTVGGVDVSLLDQVVGYSVLATGGIMRGQQVVVDRVQPGDRSLEPISLLKVTDADRRVLHEFKQPIERRVIPPEFPYLVTSILADGKNQCITFGVCNALALPDGRPAAVKTGTSEPFEGTRQIGETWTIGYTPEVVIGVWSGNADNAPITGIYSTTVSFRSWRDAMVAAFEVLRVPPTPFTRPPGVAEREVCWPSGKLPTELCPPLNRYKSLFAESALPRDTEKSPQAFDSWWQKVKLDSRTGLLATPSTPASFMREEVRLVLPKEEVENWKGMLKWAEKAGVRAQLAPTDQSSPSALLVNILTPSPSSTVGGRLILSGKASSPKFVDYAVEWGRGVAPANWVRVYQSTVPVENGTLAIWDTSSVPDGPYVLRIVLQDEERGRASYQVPLLVENRTATGQAPPPSDNAPFIAITNPGHGEEVRGTLVITGTAAAADLRDIVIEVGPGQAPVQWLQVARLTTSVINGVLGSWVSTAVADGTHTIRITVSDRRLGSSITTVTVNVRNRPGG